MFSDSSNFLTEFISIVYDIIVGTVSHTYYLLIFVLLYPLFWQFYIMFNEMLYRRKRINELIAEYTSLNSNNNINTIKEMVIDTCEREIYKKKSNNRLNK